MNYKWVDDFILNEILAYNSEFDYNELYVKSYCEYILFCYQTKCHLNKLSESSYHILNRLEGKQELLYCKHILELCLYGKTQHFSEKYSKSIEYFYIVDLIDGRINIKFWNTLFSNFFKLVVQDGITDSEAYNFTHYIFYSTNFGQNIAIIEGNLELKISLTAILNLCISKYEREDNWDLCFELYICLLIVDSQYEFVEQKLSSKNYIFQSNQGWILSNGRNKNYFEENYNNLNFRQKYSLFHTTIIYKLLRIKIQNYTKERGFAVLAQNQ